MAVRAAFADALIELREEARLTQEVLAHRAGLHRNHIGMLERGERLPTIASIMAIAKGLRMPAHQIVKRMEERMR